MRLPRLISSQAPPQGDSKSGNFEKFRGPTGCDLGAARVFRTFWRIAILERASRPRRQHPRNEESWAVCGSDATGQYYSPLLEFARRGRDKRRTEGARPFSLIRGKRRGDP